MSEPAEATIDPRRIARLVKFAQDQVTEARRELALRWPDPAERERSARARPVIEHVAALAAVLERYKRGLASHAATPDAAERGLPPEYAPEPLIMAGKALAASVEGMRRPLGTAPIAPRPAAPRTSPLAGPPSTGGLAARLQTAFTPILARAENPPKELPPKSRTHKHLDTYVRFGRLVMDQADPKLTVVGCALRTVQAQAPGQGLLALSQQGTKDAASAGVAAPLQLWIPRLIRLNLEHPTARRVEQHALGQWEAAQATHRQAASLLREVETRGEAALAPYDPARASAALTPLLHLPMTFREVPVLNELFPLQSSPGPLWEAWRKDLDALSQDPDKPAAAPPRPTVPLPPPVVVAAATTEDADMASTRRLSAIVAYLNAPAGDPAYRDPAVMFRVVSEEHQYQSGRLAELLEQTGMGQPAPDGEVEAIERRIKQLNALRKKLAAQPRPS